jgi:protein gp37
LLLTNFAERLEEFAHALSWPTNVWMGVTVENVEHKWRIDCLRRIGAAFKFVSFEPLIGDVGTLNLDGIDWVIIGGEIGANPRPTAYRWVQNIFCQCAGDWRGGPDIPIYFKGWGEWLSHRLLPQKLPLRKTEIKIIQNACANDEIEVMLRVGKIKAGNSCPCAAYHPQFPEALHLQYEETRQ